MKASTANVSWSGDTPDTHSAHGRAVTFPTPGQPPHGAAEVVSVQAALRKGASADRLQHRLLAAGQRAPLSLHPVDFPSGLAGMSAWERFCGWLLEASTRRGVSLHGLATCVHSHRLPLEDFHAVTDSAFGRGPRFVLLDGLQMQPQANERIAAMSAANWTYLWRARVSSRPVLPVYGGFVRSTCPLLSDEAAVTVLPMSGLLAPAHSAWFPVQLDLAALADARGELDLAVLKRVLRDTLAEADRQISGGRWPGRHRQADARLNRRVALIVTGVGDLVARRGDNPGALACLKSMQVIIETIRDTLRGATADLARRLGEVPALEHACPPGNWFVGSHHQAWQARFDAARLEATVRHRNLLAMSPYAVLPTSCRPTPEFMDMLPLLALADAWTFAGTPRISSWNVKQFRYFHRRARAIIQASQSTSRVAAGV